MSYKIFFLVVFLFVFNLQDKIYGQAIITGSVFDSQTGESLIGCNVYIQGTQTGVTTDLDGNFTLKLPQPGTYTIVASYVSYNPTTITVNVPKNGEVKVNIKLDPATVTINEVTVIAKKRQNTELSMLNTIKAQDVIVSGISAQQIQKSQDRDAAEVLRRIPGITITDGRFVIVRGLMERYNSVLLNGVTAPSSEADARAFSFDVMPSNMIDNIIIYKTPAPEFPADYSGAAINVITRNTVDEPSVSFSYGTGYVTNTTFKNFYTYKGGKYDWLGFDDGTRALPTIFPARNMMNDSLFKFDYIPLIADSITKISKAFRNDVFTPFTKKAIPNQSMSLNINQRFKLWDIDVTNLTSIMYNYSTSTQDALRAAYLNPNPFTGEKEFFYYYYDSRYNESVRAGILHNWTFSFNENHKLELRNFFNQNSRNRTVIREGVNYYTGSLPDSIMSMAMEFTQRTTYSGQLTGTSTFNDKNTEFEWILGYSYADKQQPDFKRLFFLKQEQEDGIYRYRMSIANGLPLPERGGRFYLEAYEHIRNVALNFKQNIPIANGITTIKTGIFYEYRNRQFDARNIGIIIKGSYPTNMFYPIDSILQDKNFFYPGGFAYNENSPKTNHYKAFSNIMAAYLGLKVPILKRFTLYSGMRVEKYEREISEFQLDVNNIPNITLDTLDWFFSSNLSYNINEKHIVRVSYGKTVNRPEFREIVPYYYKDFDLNAGVWGNDTIKNCYIHNYDLRYEWYPTPSEMISLAVFYKKFNNPIEIALIETGNQPDYKPFNTEKAYSRGVELDVRKNFDFLSEETGFLYYLKNFTIVFNASWIKSNIKTNVPDAREQERQMMGQSPYIINGGLYFNSEKQKLMISLLYNRLGERLVAIGTKNTPHIWELPRNSIDFTLSKGIFNGAELRIGIKDLLNEPIRQIQYESVYLNATGEKVDIKQTTHEYKPGTTFSITISFMFQKFSA